MATDLLNDLDIEELALQTREYGPVYRARQRSVDRPVALHHFDGTAGTALDDVRRSLEMLCQLKDRNVVEVLGVGTKDGRPFCLTESTDGEDIETQLRNGTRFTTDEILHIADGVALGLKAAARLGVAHGNLRPANVVLTADGTVKVAGLGMQPRPGGGTPSADRIVYLSPEQASGGPVDARSDLYSLGAILYELATGRPPFDGYDSATSLLFQVAHVDPPGPRQLGSSIPREVERLILRCLHKDPAGRPASATDLLATIRQIRESMSSSANPAVAAESDTGDFDIYEDQILGEGGMGTLMRGRQRSLDRSVAIKVMREAFAANTDFSQRFRREAELLAQVDCPNVVQVFGTGTWKGRLFFAMELVKGEDLESRLKRGHRFPPAEILNIAEGVALALKAAWRYMIIHRDIKPSNILLTPEGAVKVADFGLAKSLRIPGDSKVLAGTAEYLSPEQGLGQRVDIRSDLYSLGVVLYELAAGHHPFVGVDSSIAMIFQHVHTDPPPLAAIQGDVPAELKDLIHTCLRKDPAARFQTPDALLKAVRAAHVRLPVPATAVRMAVAASPDRRRRRRFLAVAVGLLACFAIGGAGTALLLRSPPKEDRALRDAYALALGLGDFDGARALAEGYWGVGSREAADTELRRREHVLRVGLEDAARRIAARDWEGAAKLYPVLIDLSPDARRDELQAALRFCEDLRQAAGHERAGEVAGALAIYRRLAVGPTSVQPWLRERVAFLERRR